MREIKFRVWAGGGWIDFKRSFEGGGVGLSQHDDETPNIFELQGNVAGDKWKWCQYTGLKDKNGVEIYEGDILALGGTEKDGHKGDYEHVAVEIENVGGRGYRVQYGLGNHNWHAPYWVKVIGNIYENPELLK